MKEKENIVLTYSYFGKKLYMEFNKEIYLEDYRMYCAITIMNNKQPKSVKTLLREKFNECLVNLIESEHDKCYYRY
jgi:hypothetical protein